MQHAGHTRAPEVKGVTRSSSGRAQVGGLLGTRWRRRGSIGNVGIIWRMGEGKEGNGRDKLEKVNRWARREWV
jgi:hypothetical protein